MKYLFFIILFSFISFVSAEPLPSTVTKNDFKVSMRSLLPDINCKKNTYHMHCYAVATSECKVAMSLAIDKCLSDMDEQIPETLMMPNEPPDFGLKVAICSKSVYEIDSISKYTPSKQCDSKKIK